MTRSGWAHTRHRSCGGRRPREASGDAGNQADNSASNAGAVYVFIRIGTTWMQQAYLKRACEADDHWSADEESADWFLWLAGSAADAQFYRYFTTE